MLQAGVPTPAIQISEGGMKEVAWLTVWIAGSLPFKSFSIFKVHMFLFF